MQVLENLVPIILTILAETFDFYHKNKKISLKPSLETLRRFSEQTIPSLPAICGIYKIRDVTY